MAIDRLSTSGGSSPELPPPRISRSLISYYAAFFSLKRGASFLFDLKGHRLLAIDPPVRKEEKNDGLGLLGLGLLALGVIGTVGLTLSMLLRSYD